jgi:hypothetical protein
LSGFPISSEVNSADSDANDIPFNQLAKINTIAQVDRETLVAFDQHVRIEDDTNEWEKNLIESLWEGKLKSITDTCFFFKHL